MQSNCQRRATANAEQLLTRSNRQRRVTANAEQLLTQSNRHAAKYRATCKVLFVSFS
ncbi:MAG: hypothetical protein ACI4BD_08215 [Paludibacteraceae bacterium]